MKIYISGLYSGANPQPGVGIARSMRLAYPSSILVGVEYSNRCSGIHWQDFDDVSLQRPWEEINLDLYAQELKHILDSGALFISANDLEILWLADVFPDGHPNLLTPPLGSLRKTAKPAVEIHYPELPVKIPQFVSTQISDWNLHKFCRRQNWQVWLKGPYYEALQIGNWAELERARTHLSKVWKTENLFLQTHVAGYEESVALSAYQGELLGSVSMKKRDLTDISKTWAGDVGETSPEIAAPLKKIIKDLNWTGGAELEMIRDGENQLWLLEWNPRYPAWIHGATIAGVNLPALLVEGATAFKARKTTTVSREFTRVVLEIPVRSEFPLPPSPSPNDGSVGNNFKHPSGLSHLASRLQSVNPANRSMSMHSSAVNSGTYETKGFRHFMPPNTVIEDFSTFDFKHLQTPAALFLEKTARHQFKQTRQIAEELSTNDLKIVNAYSLKTNPDMRLLEIARENGFLCEAISPPEVNKALEIGFPAEQVVLNGPGKWWRSHLLPQEMIHAIFADSTADLKRIVANINNGNLKAKIVGIRLRLPQISSRFGISIDSPNEFSELLEAIKTVPPKNIFGVHFHMASSNVGVGNWRHLFQSVLRWCASIETLTGRSVKCLDIGGGWSPDDWRENSRSFLEEVISGVRKFLPSVSEIIAEPGKALAQPSMAVAMRILEIHCGKTDAVVDGSIAELPMHLHFPHRILYKCSSSDSFFPLKRGKMRLLGRSCMEHDILATHIELPEYLSVGDQIIFCDAGGYDRSMSYDFGRG